MLNVQKKRKRPFNWIWDREWGHERLKVGKGEATKFGTVKQKLEREIFNYEMKGGEIESWNGENKGFQLKKALVLGFMVELNL